MQEKYYKPALMLLFLVMSLASYGQQPGNTLDLIAKRFNDYVNYVPWEEIYIHTDRQEYIAGEDLWLSTYLIDRKSLKTTSGSSIVYIELLNFENRPVVQKRYQLKDGFGQGHIKLSDTLSSGNYLLVAYTNWMKNFLPDNCFQKQIEIYNTYNKGKYRIIPQQLGSEHTDSKNIPGDFEQPVKLEAVRLLSGDLKISISESEDFKKINGSLIHLIVQTRGNLEFKGSLEINWNLQQVIIPEKNLLKGINQIAVFNDNGQLVCEKYINIPGQTYKSFSVVYPDSIGTRERISVIAETRSNPGLNPQNGNFSISVAPCTNHHFPDLEEYLLLGTEFGSEVNDTFINSGKSYYSSEGNDSVQLTLKSHWIDWSGILSSDKPKIKYLHEKEDHFLNGRIVYEYPSSDKKANLVLLCIPGKEPEFQYSALDTEGKFGFSLPVDNKIRDLIIMPDNGDKKAKIFLESSFYEWKSVAGTNKGTIKKCISENIKEWSVNYQVRSIFGDSAATPSLFTQELSGLNPVRFYGKPDIEIKLSDYVSLPKMEEVFFEIVPFVSLNKKNGQYRISLADRINDNMYEFDPFVFIDGVKILNASFVADLDPADVERIDVVKEKYIIGSYVFPGIVNVITKSADFSAVQLPDYMTRLSYRPVDPLKEFKTTDYSSGYKKISPEPDLRTTIYWHPALKQNGDGSVSVDFWTSDYVSDYDILIQGITSDGNIFSARKKLHVKQTEYSVDKNGF